MAWTLGTSDDHATDARGADGELHSASDIAARQAVQRAALDAPLGGRRPLLMAIGLLAGITLWALGFPWAPWAALAFLGAVLLLSGLQSLARARPPADGPLFAIDRIHEGPVEVVGRVVPPRLAVLSPLTSTKCSYFAYRILLLDEASGEKRVLEERSKLCDFWLKDVTGSIWVRSEGIDVRLPRQLDEDLRTYDQTPRAVGEHLHKLGVDPFLAPGVRRAIFLEETRLDPGDNVLVKGSVVRDEAGKLVICKAPGGTLSVERWTRPTFVAQAPGSARVGVWLGAGLLLAGLGGAAHLAGWLGALG